MGVLDHKLEEVGLLKVDSGTKHLFIADSGASCHLTGSMDGMVNCLKIHEYVTVGNGKAVQATMIGTKKGRVRMPDGSLKVICLHGCKYVPDLAPFNLFSLTKTLSAGGKLGNVGEVITIAKDGFTLSFDHKIRTKTGYVGAVEILPLEDEEVAAPALEGGETIDINKFHALLGHVSEEKARAVAKYYGVKLSGKFVPCSACAEAKARQRNIPKSVPDDRKCSVVGERLHMDISSIKARSFGGAKYWLMVLDEATGYAFSYFLKRKCHTATTVLQLVRDLKAKGKTVRKIRCDDAGENKTTEKLLREHGFGVDFE